MDVRTIYLYIKIQWLFCINKRKLSIEGINSKLWKRKFLNLLEAGDARCEKLLIEFITCKMEKVSDCKIKKRNKYSPILFCVIKNDIYKISHFMDYYRNLGVEVFIFLDNASDDGTKEFLCRQKDAIVYNSDQQYSSERRVAWINRLLARYGQNRWCLVVDSDELVTYIGNEQYKFADLVRVAIKNHYFRLEGFMLDMYSDDILFQNENPEDYASVCRYFDTSSYELYGTTSGVVIKGGPRKRVFHADVQLSKYPLFYYRDDDFVASSHYMIPFEPINKSPIWFAICHYKFIDENDLDKVKKAVQNENYASGSMDYKQYLSVLKANARISFYDEGNTCELKESNDLKRLSFLRSPF